MNKYSTGTTENRPERNLYAGFEYFNTTLKLLQIYNGTSWDDVFKNASDGVSIDTREPGIYGYYSTIEEQPGENAGYGNLLIVYASTRNNISVGCQLFIGGKDQKVYIRSFQGPTFSSWNVLINTMPHVGTTAQRPANTSYIKKEVGFQYFDKTLGKPIYWNGTAWVDATGATV